MEEVKVSKSKELNISGQDYIISFQASSLQLFLELEMKYDSSIWRNTFSSNYIEEMTRKTGSKKSFEVFLNMLASAFTSNHPSLNMEILSYQDLENLKMQKSSQSTQSNQSSKPSATTLNKRYLILNYSSDFEKVNYPLPLIFESDIENAKLKGTIKRMKTEIQNWKSQKFQMSFEEFGHSRESFKSKDAKSETSYLNDQLKQQNDILKAKIKRAEETQLNRTGPNFEILEKEKEQNQIELQKTKEEMDAKISDLEKQCFQKDKELAVKMAEVTAFKKELTNLIGKQEVDKRIREYIEKMDQQQESLVIQAKKQIIKLDKDIDKAKLDLENYKKLEYKQNVRIKQLESELENNMKKFSYKNVSNRLYSNNSYGNRSFSNRAQSNSSKNSQNSRNTSNSAPQMRNRTYGSAKNSPVQPRTNTYQRKPVSGGSLPHSTSPGYKQPIKRQPLYKPSPPKPINRSSPNVQRQPINNRSPNTRQPLYKSPVGQRQPVKQPIPNRQPIVNRQPIANRQPVVNRQPIANRQPLVNRQSQQVKKPSPVYQRSPQQYQRSTSNKRNEAQVGNVRSGLGSQKGTNLSYNANQNRRGNQGSSQKGKTSELDNKIANLKNLLQKAKK